ncbi:CHAD domain-containing protein [Streptomyces sp. NPDC049954]|uniref:CHAD domain-containing protein n=1 Tax=Streptomyces sp. NPDC049954 TaxID=3155779 RepID=UPI003436C254
MAPRPLDPPVPGGPAAGYLREQATGFLRALRLQRESGTVASDAAEAARALRRTARRIDATLHTFRPLFDPDWADTLRTELGWLAGTLGREHAYAERLERLLGALHRLSQETAPVPALPQARAAAAVLTAQGPGTGGGASGALSVGAARAGALLERQLTLARNRAHSAALGALGSGRFHAVADSVAVLASEVPLRAGTGTGTGEPVAPAPLAERTAERLGEAVTQLPLGRAGVPYNAQALVLGEQDAEAQDTPWLRARQLLRLRRYAVEAMTGQDDPALRRAAQALDRHRDAAEAASAAASAARTPRIAPATAYSLGVLHADQRHEVEAARYAFHRAWQREAAWAG